MMRRGQAPGAMRVARCGMAVALAWFAGSAMGCRKEPTAEAASSQLQQAFPDGAGSDAVRLAIKASEAKDYSGSVIAMDAARSSSGLSANQLATMEQTRKAIIADLTRRADSGDATAKAHLQAIERSRSQ